MSNRLTTETPKTMLEMSVNQCFVKNGDAWRRDFETEQSVDDYIRNIVKRFAPDEDKFPSEIYNGDFSEYMFDCLDWGDTALIGVFANYYNALCAMAELRDKLADYEDAEENGLLVRLPCKVGDTVYELSRWCDGSHGDCDKRPCNECPEYETKIYTTKFTYEMLKKVGKTVFLTQAEAEQALKEREKREK